MSKRGQGEGSIYQMADGRWRAAVSVGWKVNGEGNAVLNRKIFTAETREAVQKKLTKALRDRDMGLPLVSEKQTVGQYLKQWLEDCAKPHVRPKTFESYSWIIEHHLIPGLGRVPLAKLSPQQIQAFMNEQLKSGRVPNRGRKVEAKKAPPAETTPAEAKPQPPTSLTPRTVQHIHATLRAALDQAERWDLVPRNVARLVDAPRVRRPEVKPFSVEQAREFLKAIEGDRLAALYSVAMALGLRQGEALGLQRPDIDLEAGLLTVKNSLQRIEKPKPEGPPPDASVEGPKTSLQLVETKTPKSRRTIKLPQACVNAMWKHFARQEKEKEFAGDEWKDTGFVFTTSVGTPLDGPTVTHRFQAALKAAGLPKMRFHDLRHTCATLLLAQGVHPRIVMEILGHSQIGITMNLYSHVLPAMQEEVASKMDEILNPTPTPGPVATRVATKTASEKVN